MTTHIGTTSASNSYSQRPVALITGGVKRVGLAIATALARSGCDIIVTYRSDKNIAELVVTQILEAGGPTTHAQIRQLDLDDLDAIERFSDSLAHDRDSLDVLIHNASIYGPTPLASVTQAEALRHYRINALAPLLLTKHLAPKLAASRLPGGGAIVAMLDIHAMGLPRAGHAAYAMSKAALHEMVRTLAKELAPKVRVNGVAPGVVAWPESADESSPAMQAAYLSRVPLGRAGTPEDAAEAVRWLALDAPYVTGHVIRVDGGRSLT